MRAIYSSTKQVTNYVFSERELEFTRVVAVEYPLPRNLVASKQTKG